MVFIIPNCLARNQLTPTVMYSHSWSRFPTRNMENFQTKDLVRKPLYFTNKHFL